MATTTNYGWTTPDDTALVKDGAAAIRSLGSAIDSTLKTQIDAQIPDSIVDAKGDIIAATAADTVARLAVGANNTVLTADSTQTTGLKWASPSGTPSQIIPQISGSYVRSPRLQAVNTSTAVLQEVNFSPIYLTGISFDRISITTASTFSGTATVRLGIYNADLATGKPSTVYLDAGTVSCTAVSTTYEITISTTPPAGVYYLAFNTQTAATTNTFQGIAAGYNALSSSVGASFTGNNTSAYFTQSGVSGAFATAGTLTAQTGVIAVGLRMV